MCVQNGKKSLKSSKIAKIVKNRKKWSKIAKIVKNRQKIAINRQKSLIIVEISNRNHRRELQWLSGIYHNIQIKEVATVKNEQKKGHDMLKAGPATLGTQVPDF